VSHEARGLFNASVQITLGDGSSILFREDAWIGGLSAVAIAPALLKLLKLVRPSAQKRHTVKEGLLANRCALDIAGELSTVGLDIFLCGLLSWRFLAVTSLRGATDYFRCKWEGNGPFSS
jgi:hypothetical protein